MSRSGFREACVWRDDGECVVPWCDEPVTADPIGPGEVHHIIERRLWDDGGYFADNGACVCNRHHRRAESNEIPPQAFWDWIGVDEPILPGMVDALDVNKWGDDFETPSWTSLRSKIKYPSTGHLPFSPEWDGTRVDLNTVDQFIDVPIVCTVKMDGSNAMLVRDVDDPVRARNGKYAEHLSFDKLKQEYWDRNLYEKIPEHIQVFGEWLYAKHSIHYGCNCSEPCGDVGPKLDAHFQVFGIYDTRYNLWLSWPETKRWAGELGFPTTPVLFETTIDAEYKFYDRLVELGEDLVENGHEGFVVRSSYPIHYGQFEQRIAKYVREGHVDPDADHWSTGSVIENVLHE